MDIATGLVEATSEREFFLLVLSTVVGGGLIFALSWKGIGVFRDMHMRDMDTIDKIVCEEGDPIGMGTKKEDAA